MVVKFSFTNNLDKYIDSMSEKFRKKCVMKRAVYSDVLKRLSLPKDKSVGLFSSQFIYWMKQRFVLTRVAVVEIGCCIKSKKTICSYEAFYNVISETYVTTSREDRHKTVFELNTQYS